MGIGVLALAGPFCILSLDSTLVAAPKTKPARQTIKSEEPTAEDAASTDDDGADKFATVRLNYIEASWSKVLKDVAEATDTQLVADHMPSKKFSRWDLKRHTRADALKILNQALEPENYRLQFKGNHLVLNHLSDFRHEYPQAVLRGDPRDMAREQAKSDTGIQNAAATEDALGAKTPRRGQIKQASGEADSRSATMREKAEQAPAEPIETTVRLKSRKALEVTKIMYKAFKPQVEEIDDGPQGLSGFQVRRQSRRRTAEGSDDLPTSDLPVQFSIGMDRNKNQLVVHASPNETKSIVRFIKTLDAAPKNRNTAVKAVKTTKDAGRLAAVLQPQLDRLSGETRKIARQQARPDGDADDAQDGDLNSEAEEPNADQPRARRVVRPGARRGAAGDQADDEARPTTPQGLLGSLKGEVRVESVPELGILVVTGNQNDVDAVMEVIQEIERLSKGTAPEVQLQLLRHVSSEALAALLTTVYERLASVRNSAVQQSQAITVFPVSRPNAVLIVASKSDMNSVISLIDELDQPSDPASEFMVYRLKYAVPSQIVDKVEAMYPPQQQAAGANQQGTVGLIPRVRIIDDLRTNSVVVQARPRDLREVKALIDELDVKDTEFHLQIRIFPLQYAVADEVAFTLSDTITKVLSPARATAAPTTGQPGAQGQFGQAAQAQGAGGQGAQELREVKSAILQFLDVESPEGRELRSGILSDIRMTGDLRTNSIVVTASEDSMEFVAALIKRLDKPSANVAEIKVFPLKNADATSVQTLLERLFGIQRTGQQGAQGGQAAGQGQVPGLLMADSEDSSSMLIPLRFSVDPRTNTVIAIGGGGALTVVEAIVLQLDATNIPQRKNEVYRLKMNTAQNVATAISQFLQTQQQALTAIQPETLSPFEQIEREVIVVPEAASNSVLISATPRYFEEIHKLIKELDRTPQQVLIQGLIVEVQLTSTDEFGMEFGIQDSILFKRSPLTAAPIFQTITNTSPNGVATSTQNILSQSAVPGYNFTSSGTGVQLGNNTNPGINATTIGAQGATGFNTGLTNSNGGLGYPGFLFQAGSENLNILLRALAARVRVDILSRPQIRALDNQASLVQVGQEIPRINGFQSNGTAGVIVPTVQQRAIGIILQVTPRITPDGLVIMNVVARKDSLSPQQISLGTSAGGTAITSPIVNTTNAQTTIAVNSGQTVIIGGMITKQDNVEERKVPLLGDIPILGRAFRYDFKQMARTEMLIFLTPRIIKSDEEAEMYKQIEMERLNFVESEAERVHGPLFGTGPEYCPPSTAPGSVVTPPEPAGPSMKSTPRRTQPPPPPPDANIPGAAARGKGREPQPMPAADDDEELDAAFIQTGYRVPEDIGSAASQSPPKKTGPKSPISSVRNGKASVTSTAKKRTKPAGEAKKSDQRLDGDS
jgi:type II secretion system protein D